MKKTFLTIQLFIALFSMVSLSGCVDDTDSVVIGNGKEVTIYFTTPTLAQTNIQTRGTHTEGETGEVEDKVESIYVLIFDKEGKTLETFKRHSTLDNQGVATVANPGKYKQCYIRLVANITPDDSWIGKNWSVLREQVHFSLPLNPGDLIPMFYDQGVMDFEEGAQIGDSELGRINFIRAVAKLRIVVEGKDVRLLGFRTFAFRKQGYVFPQETIKNIGGPENVPYEQDIKAYDNKKKAVFVPETRNSETFPENDEAYIIVKATKKLGNTHIEGFYRVDMRQGGKLIDIKRNKDYVITLKSDIGYGYSTEEEAMDNPINSAQGEGSIDIQEHSSYDFIANQSGNYLAVTNSKFSIVGKTHYYKIGFSGEKEAYTYVATIAETEKSDLQKEDITIESSGSEQYFTIDKQIIQEEGKNKLMITAKAINEITIGSKMQIYLRYKNIIKEIQVLFPSKMVNCTYYNLHLDALANYPLGTMVSHAWLTTHRKADETPGSNPDLDWVGFDKDYFQNLSLNEKTKTEFTEETLLSELCMKFREHIDPVKMGRLAGKNAEWEGHRFADAYVATDYGMLKVTVAQANADLSGFFGGAELIKIPKDGTIDEGDQYDSYLLVERYPGRTATDQIFNHYDSRKTIKEYCSDRNPAGGEKLWYLPSSRQLMGLWLTENSDSRKLSPMKGEPASEPNYAYFARNNYSSSYEAIYKEATSIYGPDNKPFNRDPNPLNVSERYPVIYFSNGETTRGPVHKETAIRCVRNLKPEELPAEIRSIARTVTPVNGRTVTMDPYNFLGDDYFRQDVWNPIARKIEVQEPHGEKQKTVVYRWLEDAGSKYVHKRTDSKGFLSKEYRHHYKWESFPWWTKNGAPLYKKDKGDPYSTNWIKSSTPPEVNNLEAVPDKWIDQEYTLADALKNTGSSRLPTMRELQLIYIYYPLLIQGGMAPFYKEEGHGYYDPEKPGDESTPNTYIWQMIRYPKEVGSIPFQAYMHWYWSSTAREGNLTGDDGTKIPQRMNFHFGDVNARSAHQTDHKDHYRLVKTAP